MRESAFRITFPPMFFEARTEKHLMAASGE